MTSFEQERRLTLNQVIQKLATLQSAFFELDFSEPTNNATADILLDLFLEYQNGSDKEDFNVILYIGNTIIKQFNFRQLVDSEDCIEFKLDDLVGITKVKLCIERIPDTWYEYN